MVITMFYSWVYSIKRHEMYGNDSTRKGEGWSALSTFDQKEASANLKWTETSSNVFLQSLEQT